MRAFGTEAKPESIFESLVPIFNIKSVDKLRDGEISTKNLKNSAFFSKMIGAVGGEEFII